MPTLKDYLNKNVSAIAARSALGVKLRTVAQSALLPALGEKKLEELTAEAITAFGEARLKEPKKDGTARSQGSVEQEITALEEIVKHFEGASAHGKPGGKSAVSAVGTKTAAPSGNGPAKPKITRGANRGR